MSIFQTFSRSGKLLGKVPDFFKNSRLCTNPASREIQNNSNFVEQIHKSLREKKGSLLCSRSGWSHAKRWGICFRFVSCLQFFFFFFFFIKLYQVRFLKTAASEPNLNFWFAYTVITSSFAPDHEDQSGINYLITSRLRIRSSNISAHGRYGPPACLKGRITSLNSD